jgi:hypothetical protein
MILSNSCLSENARFGTKVLRQLGRTRGDRNEKAHEGDPRREISRRGLRSAIYPACGYSWEASPAHCI